MQVEEAINENPIPPQSRKTTYELLFPTFAELALQGSFEDLFEVAERADMAAEGNDSPARLFLTAPLVLSYLIQDDISAARFALMRLPDKLAAHALSRALSDLIAAAWNRQYAAVYPRAGHVLDLCSGNAIPDEDLASVITSLISVFVETFRKKTFALLSKAYTSIPLSLTQTYLGLSTDQTISAAKAHGWNYDVSTQVFTPAAAFGTASRSAGISGGPSTVETFNEVAKSITRLEM